MIQNDAISKWFIYFAAILIVYMSTWEQSAVAIYPGFLLVFGVVLNIALNRGDFQSDEVISESEGEQITTYVIYGFVALIVASAITALSLVYIPLSIQGLSPWYHLVYTASMAVAEEQFFRGFVANLFLRMTGVPLFALLSGGVFGGIFHLAVLQALGLPFDYIQFYVYGFTVLTWVALQTGRLSPGTILHFINNVSVVLFG